MYTKQDVNTTNLKFNDVSEAFEWFTDYINNVIDDWCSENFYFCYFDDIETELAYYTAKEGCCGFISIFAKIGGKDAIFGCNLDSNNA